LLPDFPRGIGKTLSTARSKRVLNVLDPHVASTEENARPFNEACTETTDASTILLEKEELYFAEKQLAIGQVDKKEQRVQKFAEKAIDGAALPP
jgi:hypothetical protein